MKMRLLRCYIFSILLYGVESWTLTEATTNRLEAFEMWIYRRILRISWMDRITNETLSFQRMKKDKEIMHTIKRRKLEYLGHILLSTLRSRVRFPLGVDFSRKEKFVLGMACLSSFLSFFYLRFLGTKHLIL
uniref:Uncharacterized protein n=1 Tax=Cacopsylla melanoneura TaxID=428564 RepID=A0A8D8M6B7_9HEMI